MTCEAAGMDRKLILFCAAAIPLGLAGGYTWSALTAPAPRAATPPKATFADIPASPEELPEVSDREWENRSDDSGAAVANRTTADPEPSSNGN